MCTNNVTTTTAPLPGIPAQPRTWTFTDRNSGNPLTVTCLPGCILDHSSDIDTPSYPGDIWCQTLSRDVNLPVNATGTPQDITVLSWALNVRPFDQNMNARQPHASIEVMRDCWIEDLDPDAFEQVIDTLEERVKSMREAHAQLLRVRAEYEAGR